MENHLDLFRKLLIGKDELQKVLGSDLHNVDCKKPYQIRTTDVINAIDLFRCKTITTTALLEWVNVIWFTPLFTFKNEETECILSVIEILETMDEDEVVISEKDLSKMIEALKLNIEYVS